MKLILIKSKFKFQVLSKPESHFTGAKEPHASLEAQVADPWFSTAWSNNL